METLSNKFMIITEKINDVIVINTLFLVTNCFLFQSIFFIDFDFIFLPLFYLSSLPLLPSLVALNRTLLMKSEGRTTTSLRTYWQEIKIVLGTNIKLCFGLTTIFYIGLANLYLLNGDSIVSQLLFLLNLIVLMGEMIFAIGLVMASTRHADQYLLKESVSFITENIGKILLCMTFIGIGLYVTFSLYYPLIIIIFGVLIKIIGFLGKGKEIDGIPN